MSQQRPTEGPPGAESPDVSCDSARRMGNRLAQHLEALDTELAACALRACEALASLRSDSPEADKAIDGVVVALQFQDLASQRIALMTRAMRTIARECVELRCPEGSEEALASLDRLARFCSSCTRSAYAHKPMDGHEHVCDFSLADEAHPHPSANPCPLDDVAKSVQDDGVDLF